jgi:hypothetical protein
MNNRKTKKCDKSGCVIETNVGEPYCRQHFGHDERMARKERAARLRNKEKNVERLVEHKRKMVATDHYLDEEEKRLDYKIRIVESSKFTEMLQKEYVTDVDKIVDDAARNAAKFFNQPTAEEVTFTDDQAELLRMLGRDQSLFSSFLRDMAKTNMPPTTAPVTTKVTTPAAPKPTPVIIPFNDPNANAPVTAQGPFMTTHHVGNTLVIPFDVPVVIPFAKPTTTTVDDLEDNVGEPYDDVEPDEWFPPMDEEQEVDITSSDEETQEAVHMSLFGKEEDDTPKEVKKFKRLSIGVNLKKPAITDSD